jgi:Golgi nucleoside diphosphatase
MKALMLGLLMSFTLAFAASATPEQDKAVADGKDWLALLDSKHYADSYTQASALFRSHGDQNSWATQIKSVRDQFGDLASRQVTKVDMEKSLPGAPDGNYAVITYQSDFAQKHQAVETLVLTLEKDHWRAAGYFIK